MTLSQIKSQVEALCRKYATELAAYRINKTAVGFCDEVYDALTNPKSGPVKDALDWNRLLLKRIKERRFSIEYLFRPRDITAVRDYLEHCLEKLHVLPQAGEIVRKLLPWAAAQGLIPRTVEDPVPLCAMRRGMQESGKSNASESSGPGLSDLIEHWRQTDYYRQLAESPSQGRSLTEASTA